MNWPVSGAGRSRTLIALASVRASGVDHSLLLKVEFHRRDVFVKDWVWYLRARSVNVRLAPWCIF